MLISVMARKWILLIIILCLPIISLAADGQDIVKFGQPSIKIFTDKEGLPQNTIQCITIDKKGYIWVGTTNGAAYYNGRSWQTKDMPNRTLSNFVQTMLATNDGSMWFGTNGGGLIQYKDNQWQTFQKGNSPLPNDVVKCLIETVSETGQNGLWIGTQGGGLVRFEQGKWTVFDTSNSPLPSNNIFQIEEVISPSNIHTLWIGTYGGGLVRFEQGKWTVFSTSNSPLNSNNIRCLLHTVSATGRPIIWVGSEEAGLAYYQEDHWTIFNTSNSPLPNNSIRSLLETVGVDGRKTLWIGTNGGGLASLTDGEWRIFNISNTGIRNNQIWSLSNTTSSSGRSLWVGTNGGGLVRFEQDQWLSYTNKNAPFTDNQVSSLLESISSDGERSLWFGTYNGLFHYEKGKWSTFNTSNSPLPHNTVLSLLETTNPTGNHTLWIGTYGGGLARLENNNWTIYNTTNSKLPNDTVLSLLETRSPTGTPILWVGTYSGGVVYIEDGKWTVLNTQNSKLPSYPILSIYQTINNAGNSAIWFGTDGGGLARLEGEEWTIFHTGNSKIPNNSVFSINQIGDADRPVLWLGTDSGGVARLDLSTNTWLAPLMDTSDPPLPNNTVYNILEDSQHRIYLFTIKGVARLTPRKATPDNTAPFSIYSFTTEDGLPSNECSQGAAIIDKQGRIWAGTIGGAAVFDPNHTVKSSSQNQLYIERIVAGDKERVLLDQSSLSYNDNNFIFEFALLSYYRESDTRYRFQLEGYDAKQSAWTTNYAKEYTNLGKGDYTFNVWAKDFAGNITGPVKLSFRIKPAPWFTWWAYLCYAIASVGLIYTGHHYRLGILEKRNQILEEKVIERTAQVNKQKEELETRKEELEDKNAELALKNAELVESHKRADRIFSALVDALPNTILDGKYSLDEKIGAGGFGAVYRATHLAMKRTVAVKVFRPAPGNDSIRALERFQFEAVSACRVNHPNAVAVLDSGISAEGIAYLVMEMLEGHTLAAELRVDRKLTIERAIEILYPVTDVLTKAHTSNIIHRDIKPDNIFLHQTPEGEIVKVVDFGIAKLMDNQNTEDIPDLTGPGGLVGTPVYMAPERFEHKAYDGRSDVYSIGVMFYEMLCGQPPFTGGEMGLAAVMIKHITQPPLPLRKINSEIPEDIDDLVMRMLAKNPEERPTAKHLTQEFAHFLGVDTEYRSTTGSFKPSLTERITTKTEAGLANTRSQQISAIVKNGFTKKTKEGITTSLEISEDPTIIKPKKS